MFVFNPHDYIEFFLYIRDREDDIKNKKYIKHIISGRQTYDVLFFCLRHYSGAAAGQDGDYRHLRLWGRGEAGHRTEIPHSSGEKVLLPSEKGNLPFDEGTYLPSEEEYLPSEKRQLHSEKGQLHSEKGHVLFLRGHLPYDYEDGHFPSDEWQLPSEEGHLPS